MTTFKDLQRAGTIKRADARKIRLKDIHQEPGFNLRDKTELDEEGRSYDELVALLAEFLANGGQVPALEVRPRPDGGVWVVEGHMRDDAYLLLDSQGRLPRTPDGEFWVDVVPFEGNDADRTARILTSNDNNKLTSMARARGYRRLKVLGWSPAEIAKNCGRHINHVNELLGLANANTDVQTMVKEKVVSVRNAVATVRKHGDEAGAVLQAVAAANGGKVKPKAIKPKAVPLALWEALEKAVQAYDDSDGTISVAMHDTMQAIKAFRGDA